MLHFAALAGASPPYRGDIALGILGPERVDEGKEVDQGVGKGENDRHRDDEGKLLEEYDLASEQEDPAAEGSHGSAKDTDPHGRDGV